jgi:hypothetical protein
MAPILYLDRPMLRFALLSAAVLALAASSSDSYQFNQRGTVATPRAALHDGQPLERGVRLEGHMTTTTSSAVEANADSRPIGSSGAAVAKNQAGGAVRFKGGELVDFGLEVDSSWSPTTATREGARIAAPEDAVIGVALARRGTTHQTTDGMRLGWVVNLGTESSPVYRNNGGYVSRDESVLFRAALVPSIKRGMVTFFGSLGLATESDVPESVYVAGNQDDPGVQVDTTGAVFAVAAGASVDLGNGAKLTARVGDAFADEHHYGPQVDVGLSFDLGQ